MLCRCWWCYYLGGQHFEHILQNPTVSCSKFMTLLYQMQQTFLHQVSLFICNSCVNLILFNTVFCFKELHVWNNKINWQAIKFQKNIQCPSKPNVFIVLCLATKKASPDIGFYSKMHCFDLLYHPRNLFLNYVTPIYRNKLEHYDKKSQSICVPVMVN